MRCSRMWSCQLTGDESDERHASDEQHVLHSLILVTHVTFVTSPYVRT